MAEEYKFFDAVCKSFDKAAKYTNFDQGILEQIKQCNSVLRLHFPGFNIHTTSCHAKAVSVSAKW
jgi:hypothetical protein